MTFDLETHFGDAAAWPHGEDHEHPLVFAIAGGSGSGKTTIAQSVVDIVGSDVVARLPHDAYYRRQEHLSYEERTKINYDHPDSLENELFVEHIETLRSGQAIERPVYDFSTHTRAAETVHVEPQPVVLVEGIPREANDPQRAVILDLETGETRILGHHGTNVSAVALGQDGTTVVTADYDGVVRVGTISDDEPHLLLGHEDRVRAVDIDPLGRWIASGSHDATIRLWPMPDLSKPPLHTLPREELIAKLKTLTNLRVVRDPESSTGWKLTHDPFPGWETVPTW